MDSGLFLYFSLFLVAILLAFYLPGNIFVRRLSLTGLQKMTLSISFGIVLWALQGFLFGYLNIRWMTYLYLLINTFAWFAVVKPNISGKKIVFPKITKQNTLLFIFIIIIVLSQLSMTFANGATSSKGLYFCCGFPDTFANTALTNELINNFPPKEPGVSGVLLKNYHFLANLTNADLIRIFHIPLMYLQFQYTILLITLLFILNILTFAQLAMKNRLYIYWILFFVFFSGDLLFLLIFFQTHILSFNHSFLENAADLWFSPPRVYGAALFFAGLSFLYLWLKEKRNIILDILLAVTFGSLIGFKVYFGIFALTGLGVLTLLYLKQKEFRKVITCFAALLISICLFLPINSGAGGFVFTGFWRFEDFAANSLFGLQKMESARYVYLAHGNWLHALLNDFLYIINYFVFIFGTILISLIQTKKSLSLLDNKLNIFLISGIVLSFILGSFFIQKTGGSNSSQFLINDMILLSIYAALTITYWSSKLKRKKLLVIVLSIIIICLTIPRVIYENYQSLWRIDHQIGVTIDENQLAALDFLRNKTPENAVILQSNRVNCEYIPFLTQRNTYVCLDGAPSDRGLDLTSRLAVQDKLFQHSNKSILKQLPHLRIVQYLYMPTPDYLAREKIYLKYGYVKQYSNAEITIQQVY
ncbi:MAG TPA: hypothetical protein VND99_01125 [Candidatus Acidoferrales bacterium]|nr:hypothetical protein [Candidatus Acidoferrales bacterium]